jgi:hypothetical protein
MNRTVSKKHTAFGAKRELALIIRAKVWPTCTTKGAKGIIVRLDLEKFFNRRLKI